MTTWKRKNSVRVKEKKEERGL